MDKKECCNCGISKNKKEFYKQKSWCKKCILTYQRNRAKARKLKAVEVKGGKCYKCGYNKNLSALDFHHVNPEEKEYKSWCVLRKRPWKEIIRELKKCILLCKNCHAEEHNPLLTIQNFKKLPHDRTLNSVKHGNIMIVTGICPVCKEEVFGTKFCSIKCARKSQRRVMNRPSKSELEKMIKVMSWVSIGKKYEVSDNTIRKWAKSYNLL